MKKLSYKYCVIHNHEIKLSNNRIHSKLEDDEVENVEVVIDDDGLLELNGTEIKYQWNGLDWFETERRPIKVIFSGFKITIR